MEKFRVALSGDFRKPSGEPAFKDFDLAPLEDDPAIETAFVDPVDGVMPAEGLEGFDALILLIPRFDERSVPKDGRLSIVARFGVGFDTVDLDACTRNGIAACITPDGVRRPVATSILALVLALSLRMTEKDRITREGPDGWAKKADYFGTGLVGRTMGSLGIGNIGAEFYRLAAPLEMVHIAHDPYADPAVARELGIELVAIEELFRRSDFLSVSCPLNEETRGIVNAERLALMKPTAYLVNTARGPIVDQAALTAALKERRIAGAGIDVLEVEPAPVDTELYRLDNVIVTPHALCFTDQCFAGIGAADVAAVKAVMRGEVPRGVVNTEVLETARWKERLAGYRARAAA